MECSEENECVFCDLVIGQNTTKVNADVLELDCANVLESDLAPGGAEALESGVSARVSSFTHECSNGHQNKAIDAYLRKILEAHEKLDHGQLIKGSEVA